MTPSLFRVRLSRNAMLLGAIGGFALAGIAPAAVIGPGPTGKYYERVDTGSDSSGLTYEDALTAAAALSYNGMPGQLLNLDNPTTTAYTTELDYVFTNVYEPGVTSDLAYWIGGTTANNSSPWYWLDGNEVPSDITATWDIDFHEGNVAEGASFYESSSETVWDYAAADPSDIVGGYIVEFDPVSAVPEPATLGLLALGGAGLLLRKRRK